MTERNLAIPDSTTVEGTVSVPAFQGLSLAASVGLFGSATSAAAMEVLDPGPAAALALDGTTAGVNSPSAPGHADAVQELRALTGLSWDQLARLFGVSRRAVHLWAAGNPINAVNEEHLHRTLAVLTQTDLGASAFNRAALLRAGQDGIIPFDLLAERKYEEAALRMAPGAPRRPPVQSLASRIRPELMPAPPAELLGALHGKVHRDLPGGHAARSMRVPGERKG